MTAVDLGYSDAALTTPARHFAAITKSDTVDLPYVTRAIYVGGAGNIAAVDVDGNVVTFNGALAGTTINIRVRRINDATTATNLVALW